MVMIRFGDSFSAIFLPDPLSFSSLLEQKAEPDHLQGIQQVVQQTSRVNQTMSSVMGLGGGTSTRANVLFDDFYYGF
jgi:hypothetical protein